MEVKHNFPLSFGDHKDRGYILFPSVKKKKEKKIYFHRLSANKVGVGCYPC